MEIDAGVVTAELFFDTATESDPLGTALSRVTVQVVDWPFARVFVPQESEETVGGTTGAFSVREKVRDVLLALAVTTAVVVEATADPAVAVNVAELDPDETVTEDGTVRAALLSDTATDWPPLGAALSKVTVHVEDPGAVQDEGLQLRLLTVGGAGTGCEIVTVPVLPDDVIELPEPLTADVFVIWSWEEVAEVPEEIVAFTTATTPLEIVVVLNPVARQIILPDPPEQVTDFPAADAAAPVETFTAENTDVEYVIVH